MGMLPNQQPTMKYADYESLVITHGVELVGWTEGTGVCPIKRINTALQLRCLLTALNTGECHWEQLTEDNWATHKAAHKARLDAGLGHQRAPHRDKGTSHKGKQPLSSETVNSDSSESDEENVDLAA